MKKTLLVVLCCILFIVPAAAHPGRTDADGGHWDSAAGEYHYHHGYPAHQHPDGICPYEYDDKTGASSGASESSNAEAAVVKPASDDSEPTEAPAGYPNAVNYDIVPTSCLIDRTYYFDENGFMYTPFPFDDIPHGAVETDNRQYLQYDSITLNQVVYQYGLEKQSEQFQQGAMFGIHEASQYYDYWYEQGFADSQQENDDVSHISYPYDSDDGTYATAYNSGYSIGCAILAESNSSLLSNAYMISDSLSQSDKIDEKTLLQECGLTFEEAFDLGYQQSERDFYECINQLIASSFSSNETMSSMQKVIIIALIIVSVLAFLLILWIVHLKKENRQVHEDYQKYIDIANVDRSRLVHAITERDETIRRLSCPCSSDITPILKTFGVWPNACHQSPEQYQRYLRSVYENLTLLSQQGDQFKIKGSSGHVYQTSFSGCTCPDFINNLHRKAPCKHIYFLARQCGVDVDSIFKDYPNKSE